MEDQELSKLFFDKIRPYEERIQKLEESEKLKETEIVTLKHAILNLNTIISNLKSQQPAPAKPVSNISKPAHGSKFLFSNDFNINIR